MSGAALEYEARSVTARTAGIFASAQPAAENLRSVAEDIVDLNGHADATFCFQRSARDHQAAVDRSRGVQSNVDSLLRHVRGA
jgi:hypothetical protein